MKIGLLILEQFTTRRGRRENFYNSFQFVGFRRIIQEIHDKFTPEFCHITNLGKFDIVLCSLTSSVDYENLIYNFEKYRPRKGKCKLLVGGCGVLNIKIISKYIDIAVWGRAEGQILEILAGGTPHNVWRKEIDPDFSKKYKIRQSTAPASVESIGCKKKCYFCEYTWARKCNYQHGRYTSQIDMGGIESDWESLQIDSGKSYISALDGFTEKARFLVNKNITDDDIIKKLAGIPRHVERASLRIYCVVGYPWDTPQSTRKDIDNFISLLKSIDSILKTQLFIFFRVFLFSPVPIAPMRYCRAQITENYQAIMREYREMYKGKSITSYIQCVSGPLKLLKRLMSYRGDKNDLESFKKILFTKKLKKINHLQAVKACINGGLVRPEIYGTLDAEKAPFTFLETYCDVEKIAARIMKKPEYRM